MARGEEKILARLHKKVKWGIQQQQQILHLKAHLGPCNESFLQQSTLLGSSASCTDSFVQYLDQ